jgi:putative hydrolase of the HAD superfamily
VTLEADALVFDFGGTLDTDGVHWSEKFRDVYGACGVPLAGRAFDEAFLEAERRLGAEAPLGVGFDALLARQVALQVESLARAVSGLEPATLAAAVVERVGADVRATVDRIRPLLARLARRRPIAVVSNFYGNLEPVLRDLGLAELVAVAIDSVRAGVAKPDPAIFQLAVRALGVPAHRCLVVGDSYDRDIVPGRAAGCPTAWLKVRSWRTYDDTSAADVVIASLAELPAVLGEPPEGF